MRFNPEQLRKTRIHPPKGAPPSGKTGEQLLLAILAEAERPIDARKSFWSCIADYNPLGQFGAAHCRGREEFRS